MIKSMTKYFTELPAVFEEVYISCQLTCSTNKIISTWTVIKRIYWRLNDYINKDAFVSIALVTRTLKKFIIQANWPEIHI